MRNLNLTGTPTSVKEIVTDLISEIDSINETFILGFYLVGSIPLGDFHSNKSDIDFVAICNELPNKGMTEKLRKIHIKLGKKRQKPDLSGCYCTLEGLTNASIKDIRALSFHEKKMRFGYLDMAPVTLYEVKNYSYTVLGTQASELPIEITATTLNEFMHRNINEYWKKWFQDHSSFMKRRLILYLFPRFTEWGVLGVARQLLTLKENKISSKREAGEYSLTMLPKEFHSIVNEAISIRNDNRTYPFVMSYAIRPSFKRTKETLRCMNFIIGEFNTIFAMKNV